MQAGFDAVELHAAHGYLISQFMSPYLNHRSDRFGGSFDNRMRFPLAIVQSIQGKCGRDFPVIIRYSADEWVPGGRELAESVEVAKILEKAGVAARLEDSKIRIGLNKSNGFYHTPSVSNSVTFRARSSASSGSDWRSESAKSVPT